jgi:TolB-like protein/DNA-binding winged helix-turn-helix (wHTH) protein/Tfp pilus assembly protein PilF
MLLSHKEIYRFDEFELDRFRRTLTRDHAPVALSPKAFELLAYLVANPGRVVTKEELIKAVWPESFVQESNLTQHVSWLRKAFADRAGYIVTVPGHGYQFTAHVTEERPEAELPPPEEAGLLIQSLRVRTHVVMEESSGGETVASSSPLWYRKSVLLAIALVVVLLAGAISWIGWNWHHRPVVGDHSERVMLVVLPFVNLTGDASQEYVSDGLTEEMIAQLGELNHARLGIIARTSAMAYKNTTKPVLQIGKEIGVDYVLEGSVRRWGERARISAQLIRARDQTHVWAQNYESDSQNILKLQSEVAQAIAKEIQLTLTPQQTARAQTAPRVDPRVYELYLMGRYEWNKRTEAGLNHAITYFQQAINADPNYAAAYAGMSQAYVLLPYYSGVPAGEAISKAKSTAEEALRIDDNLAEAHATLALVGVDHFDWKVAEQEYQRALQLNTNYATARQWYSFYLWMTNRHDQALEELDHARQLDPLSLIINTDEGRVLCAAHQTDQAIGLLQKAISLDPNFADAHRALALAYVEKGENVQAIREARKGVELDPNDYEKASLGYVYAMTGHPQDARKILVDLSKDKNGRHVSQFYLSFIQVGLGETDLALASLEEASRGHSSLLSLMQFEVIFDPLRADHRFLDIWRRASESKAK